MEPFATERPRGTKNRQAFVPRDPRHLPNNRRILDRNGRTSLFLFLFVFSFLFCLSVFAVSYVNSRAPFVGLTITE